MYRCETGPQRRQKPTQYCKTILLQLKKLLQEGWALKNWCFWILMLEKTLESPLDCKEFQPVRPKGNQLWIFIGRTDAEAEVPILWPPDAKSQVTGKDPDAGKDWGQEEKATTEDEMASWLNGHEFAQTPGDSEGQGSLVCCSPWGHKESDTTERLNNNKSSDTWSRIHWLILRPAEVAWTR